jgi:transcriptional regulator GlxA family with amidase domain
MTDTPPRTFGILLFDGVEELDFVGPWEMLRMWSLYAGGPPECLLVAQSDGPVDCAKGMRVLPHCDFAACPPLDGLLVPGGHGTRKEVDNPVLVDFVRRQSAQAQVTMSVCTGSLVLHAAGLLAGRRATTHWGMLPRLRTLPAVQAVEERYVQDGPVWSSAGVSAGIDMMLAYIAHIAGADTAGQVQLAAEYYPDGVRYGDQPRDPRAPAYVRGS